LINELEL